MSIRRQTIPVRQLIRRSVRYLLVSRGFHLLEAVVVFAALRFVLTGSRIAAIDRLGNRADIVVSIIVTTLAIALLRAVNRRVMISIDRRFFREAYNAQVILTELSEAIRTFSKIEELIEVVAAKIGDALHPENVTIFLEDEPTGNFVSAFSFNAITRAEESDLPSNLVLPAEGWIIRHIRELPLWNSEDPPATAGGTDQQDWRQPVRENETLRRIRAALLIPIASNGHLHGVISIGPRLGDLPYSKEDEQLLLVVAAQMSTIIENAKLIRRMVEEEGIRREIDMAAEVQRRLFPSDGLENPAVEIYGTCVPARGVGGDYYDYFEVGDSRIGIAVADVAGKGIAAALVMSTVQALLRSQVLSEDRCLTDVVSSMNSLLRRSTGESGYVTFFFAEIDDETGLLTYVNAGHNPPLLVSARAIRRERERVRFQGHLSLQSDGNAAGSATVIALATADRELPISELTTGGPIIGTFLDVPYKQETVQTESGDVLVAYTDGVTEALSPEGVEFGEGRLQSAIIQSMQLTARELTENIIAELCEWQGDAPQHDDITLVVMKVK